MAARLDASAALNTFALVDFYNYIAVFVFSCLICISHRADPDAGIAADAFAAVYYDCAHLCSYLCAAAHIELKRDTLLMS